MLDTKSAILSPVRLTKDQLVSETYLRKEVQRLNKQYGRDRRHREAMLHRGVKQAEMFLVAQKSLVPPSESFTAPRVLAAQHALQQARNDLKDFYDSCSTQGYLQKIESNHQDARNRYTQSSQTVIRHWEGQLPPEQNVNSSWSRDLGGQIDNSLIKISRVHHTRHWDNTTNCRGLQNLAKHVRENPFPPAVTMQTPLRERLARSAYPVDVSPSVLHASDKFLNDFGVKPTQNQLRQAAGFRIGKLYGSAILLCDVDHPKHGVPFHQQQRTRTLLDRKIEALEMELKNFPLCGLTLRQEEPKARIEQALGELKRIRKETTGARAEKLTKHVAQAKKNLKTKLKMLSGLKSKGFGNFSFLKAVQGQVEQKT